MDHIIDKKILVWALSSAIDLVGVTDLFHGKRVAYIAHKIWKELPDFPWSKDDVIIASLLHDCGVSSTDTHECLVHELEWALADAHCIRGQKLLEKQDDFKHLAKAIYYHHSRWSNLGIGDDQLLGNLIYLADRVDVIASGYHGDILTHRDEIHDTVVSLTPNMFNPEFVDIFCELSKKEIFWLEWLDSRFSRDLQEWVNSGTEETVSSEKLKRLFTMFSNCVDGKSPYTYNHSICVAGVAREIGNYMNLSNDNEYKLELAALLHDLGKLRVPDEILEKAGSLTSTELDRMKHHSFDTFKILSTIPGIEDIVTWAAQHHEKLNGMGYPEGLQASDICMESRILSIADIFQALAQDRPYRNGLSADKIVEILRTMAGNNEVDTKIVSLVEANKNELMNIATNIPEEYQIYSFRNN